MIHGGGGIAWAQAPWTPEGGEKERTLAILLCFRATSRAFLRKENALISNSCKCPKSVSWPAIRPQVALTVI